MTIKEWQKKFIEYEGKLRVVDIVQTRRAMKLWLWKLLGGKK